MKKRVFENWKTSLIGLVLLALTISAVVYKYATWDQAMMFVPFCVGLMYVKDTVLKINE